VYIKKYIREEINKLNKSNKREGKQIIKLIIKYIIALK